MPTKVDRLRELVIASLCALAVALPLSALVDAVVVCPYFFEFQTIQRLPYFIADLLGLTAMYVLFPVLLASTVLCVRPKLDRPVFCCASMLAGGLIECGVFFWRSDDPGFWTWANSSTDAATSPNAWARFANDKRQTTNGKRQTANGPRVRGLARGPGPQGTGMTTTDLTPAKNKVPPSGLIVISIG